METKISRKQHGISTLLVLLLFAVIFIIAFSACSSTTVIAEAKSEPVPRFWITHPEQWKVFEECVGDEYSDAVCDSCFTLVFGDLKVLHPN